MPIESDDDIRNEDDYDEQSSYHEVVLFLAIMK